MKKVVDTTKKTKRHLNFRLLSVILIICSLITVFLLIKSKLFSVLTCILFIFVFAVINFIFFEGLNSKLRVWVKNILSFFVISIILIELIFFIFGNKAIMFLSSITDNGIRTYTYNIYVLDKSDYKELKDLNNKMLSYINTDNIKDIHKELDKTIKYKTRISDDINKLMDGIIKEEVDAIILDESYEDVIKEYNNDDFEKLRKIYTFEVTTKIKIEKSKTNLAVTPFVVYISGIDTTGKISSNARSDVNLLMVVNPKTKKVALVSTPRDYYLELPSKGKRDKLTHAGLYGINESMNALGKLYDVKVDYYVRINFTSFIDIIDTIGGIEVDVEDKFCESNEERSTKKKDLICLEKGPQTLSGKQALAYARNRKAFAKGDLARGSHQMEILTAMIQKMNSKDTLSKYNKILDSLKGKMLTNINVDELYSIAKKELKDNQSYSVESYTPKIKDMNKLADCYSVGDWAYVLLGDDDSVKDISSHLKEVLGN